jgi:hypothetical protein
VSLLSYHLAHGSLWMLSQTCSSCPARAVVRRSNVSLVQPGSSFLVCIPHVHVCRFADWLRADRPFTLSSLPYANHVARLPHGLASLPIEEREEQLAGIFLSLVDLAIATVRHDPEYPSGPPSYNVVLTLEHIHVIPRKRENYTLATSGEPLSVNSMGFAGYILVKSDAELEAVKREVMSAWLPNLTLADGRSRASRTSCAESPWRACTIFRLKAPQARCNKYIPEPMTSANKLHVGTAEQTTPISHPNATDYDDVSPESTMGASFVFFLTGDGTLVTIRTEINVGALL